MFRAFPIGRLFGIRLDVHASWFPIYALVAATIANAGPIAVIGWAGAYAIGAAAALVLFASVLIHELAHALTARRFGVQTSSIALFLFGGVATLEEEPPNPLADALVALAGPATSALIALAAWGAMHAVDGVVAGALRRCGRLDARLRDLRQRGAGHVQPDSGLSDGRRPGTASAPLAPAR